MRNMLFMLMLTSIGNIFGAPGSIRDAKITGVYCGYYNGANMCSIYFSKDISTQPSCATNNKTRMQINTADATAKSLLSIALTAYTTNAKVGANGKGACTVWSDTEDLDVIFLGEIPVYKYLSQHPYGSSYTKRKEVIELSYRAKRCRERKT